MQAAAEHINVPCRGMASLPARNMRHVDQGLRRTDYYRQTGRPGLQQSVESVTCSQRAVKVGAALFFRLVCVICIKGHGSHALGHSVQGHAGLLQGRERLMHKRQLLLELLLCALLHPLPEWRTRAQVRLLACRPCLLNSSACAACSASACVANTC